MFPYSAISLCCVVVQYFSVTCVTNVDIIHTLMKHNIVIISYCILRGRIKGFNRSITTILCQVGSYRTVVG